ncbi:hypothetical protein CEXT_772731 [Caerostris extrusa]|uniref:Engrailed n=1 Tax=Caerostris extrusa TaxID=172846 RepID=A0AAV4UEX4_CAEEX|nr:hypothetical protein CEXT_772731 [Caerostris extrusa]
MCIISPPKYLSEDEEEKTKTFAHSRVPQTGDVHPPPPSVPEITFAPPASIRLDRKGVHCCPNQFMTCIIRPPKYLSDDEEEKNGNFGTFSNATDRGCPPSSPSRVPEITFAPPARLDWTGRSPLMAKAQQHTHGTLAALY